MKLCQVVSIHLDVKTKSSTRREAILAAAKALFEEVGFERATMSEITARVGGSKATLYRYFDSKEALFLELVNATAGEHGAQLMPLLDPESSGTTEQTPPEALALLALLDPDAEVGATLRRFGAGVIRTYYSPQKLSTWRMIIAASARYPQMGRLYYTNGPAQGVQLLEQHYFRRIIAGGKLCASDPRVACAHFLGLLKSEVDEPALFGTLPELTDEELARIVERAVDTFLRAYAPAPKGPTG